MDTHTHHIKTFHFVHLSLHGMASWFWQACATNRAVLNCMPPICRGKNLCKNNFWDHSVWQIVLHRAPNWKKVAAAIYTIITATQKYYLPHLCQYFQLSHCLSTKVPKAVSYVSIKSLCIWWLNYLSWWSLSHICGGPWVSSSAPQNENKNLKLYI